IDRDAGAALCRRALSPAKLRGGGAASLPVRVQALRSLPDVVPPDEAERTGLGLLGEGNAQIRSAALSALRSSSSHAAPDALMAALVDAEPALKDAAVAALAETPHPDATARLIRELEAAFADARGLYRGEPQKPAPRAAFVKATYVMSALAARRPG